MKTIDLDMLKENLVNGMIFNFETSGFLVPILFFLEDDKLQIVEIPNDYLSTKEGKVQLVNIIKGTCAMPNIYVAGIITEATIAKIDRNDKDLIKSISKESKLIHDLENKMNVIILIFSSPEKEEYIMYEVDIENKSVGDLINGEKFGDLTTDNGKYSGLFSDFFQWAKN